MSRFFWDFSGLETPSSLSLLLEIRESARLPGLGTLAPQSVCYLGRGGLLQVRKPDHISL